MYNLFYPFLSKPCNPKLPAKISIEDILSMSNKWQLIDLERKYDRFLNVNQQYLLLLDVMEDYLDIRDALIIQIQRIQRKEQEHMTDIIINIVDKNPNSSAIHYCEYSNDFQSLLPFGLRLNHTQMLSGYVPAPKEPKEYKCGCLSIKYYSPCDCLHKHKEKLYNTICKKPSCNETKYPVLKKHAFCKSHIKLNTTRQKYEEKLLQIREDLGSIKRNSNSLDYEDYQNSIASNPYPRRISRFPWKNV
jgi:hypothetical protein